MVDLVRPQLAQIPDHFDEKRARSRTWRLVRDLVGDNAGPLAELWNLDKGMLGGHQGVAHRILITLRFRVRYRREIRRVQRESVKGFEGRSLSKIGGVL